MAKQGSSPQQIGDNRGDDRGDNRDDLRGDNPVDTRGDNRVDSQGGNRGANTGGNPFSGVGWPAFPMQFPYVTSPAPSMGIVSHLSRGRWS